MLYLPELYFPDSSPLAILYILLSFRVLPFSSLLLPHMFGFILFSSYFPPFNLFCTYLPSFIFSSYFLPNSSFFVSFSFNFSHLFYFPLSWFSFSPFPRFARLSLFFSLLLLPTFSYSSPSPLMSDGYWSLCALKLLCFAGKGPKPQLCPLNSDEPPVTRRQSPPVTPSYLPEL